MANADLLEQERYGDGFVEYLNEGFTLYDDFYIDRYETKYYSAMWDRVEKELIPTGKVTQEKADEWREKVMEAGDGSFRYDW